MRKRLFPLSYEDSFDCLVDAIQTGNGSSMALAAAIDQEPVVVDTNVVAADLIIAVTVLLLTSGLAVSGRFSLLGG